MTVRNNLGGRHLFSRSSSRSTRSGSQRRRRSLGLSASHVRLATERLEERSVLAGSDAWAAAPLIPNVSAFSDPTDTTTYTMGGVNDPGEPATTIGGPPLGQTSAWWKVQVTSPGTVTINTYETHYALNQCCGPQFNGFGDTTLEVFQGTTLPGLVLVTNNDDIQNLPNPNSIPYPSASPQNFNPNSFVSFSATPGQTYYIRVNGWGDDFVTDPVGGGDRGLTQFNYTFTPTGTVYVDDSFAGFAAGQPIIDADLGTNGGQAAVFGVTAFDTIAAAQAAAGANATIIVNGGTYGETVALSGTQTLRVGGPDVAQAVTVNSVASVSGTTINIQNAGGSLTVGDAGNATIAGIISGPGSLAKTGTGILTLSGFNTYTGATNVLQGTLRTSPAAVSTTNLVAYYDFNNGGNLGLDSSGLGNNGTPQGGATSGTGVVGGALTLPANANGFLNMPNLAGLFAGQAATFSVWTKLDVNTPFNSTLTGFANLGSGSNDHYPWTDGLTYQNIFRNNSRVDSIALQASINRSEWHLVTIVSDPTDPTGGWRMYQNGILIKSVAPVFGISGFQLGVQNGFFLSGSLDDARLYNRALSTTEVQNIYNSVFPNILPDTSTVTVSGGATLEINTGETIGNLAGAGGVTLNGTLTVNETGTTTYSGNATGAGGITKIGAGNLTLSGNSNYAGQTTISAGTLTAAGTGISDASAVVIDYNSTLTLTGSEAIGSLTGFGTINLGTNTLTTGGNNASTNYGGTITGTGGLTKNGTGTLTLFGTNTYSGATNVNAGTLNIGGTGVAPSIPGLFEWYDAADASTITQSGGFVSQWRDKSGANRHLNQGTAAAQPTYVGSSINGNAVVRFDGNDVIFNAAANNTPGAPYTVLTAARMEGTQNQRLITSNNNWLLGYWSGNMDQLYADGSVRLGGGPAPNTAVHYYGATGNGSISTLVDGGRFIAQNSLGLSSPNGISLGAWQGNPGSEASKGDVAELLVYNGVLSVTQLAAAYAYLQTKWNTGGTILSDASAVTVAGGAFLNVNVVETVGNLAGAGTTTMNKTLTVNQGGTTTYSGTLQGAADFIKTGVGNLTLSGTNTYGGTTTITNGTLTVAGNAIPDASVVSVDNNSILALTGSETIGSLAGFGSVSLGASTLTAGGNGNSTTFAGVISGTGGLSKAGGGILTLTGSNTYTGTTNVLAGTLKTNAPALPTSNLIAFYDFNNVGNLGQDNSGLANNGSLVGATASGPGVSGTALALSGAGGYLSMPNLAGSFGGQAATFSVWTKLNLATPTNQFQTGFVSLGSGSNDHYPWVDGTTYQNVFRNNSRVDAIALQPGIDRANWHLVTIVSDPSDPVTGWRMYQNGILIRSAAPVFGISGFRLGEQNGYSLNGSLDDARLYNRALSTTEIQTIFNSLSTALPNIIADTSAVNVAAGATFENNTAEAIGDLSGAGTTTLNTALTVNETGTTTYSGTIQGVEGLVKNGLGTLTLSGGNTYQGLTTINAGMLVAGNANALGSTVAGTVINNGATLALPGGVALGAEAISATGSGVGGLGAIRNLAGTNSIAGPITMTPNALTGAGAGVTLQNGAASFSQGGFSPSQMIDGNLAVSAGGWANAGNAAGSNAVFETASNLNPTGVPTEFTFSIFSGGYGNHTIGKFKLYVTTDNRANFANSVDNGGQIGTNWVELTPLSATSVSGTTLTINPDNSIRASGTDPSTDTFTIKALTSLANITGIRIETIKDAGLPTSGPGRASNGNYVIIEWNIASGAANTANLAFGSDSGDLTLSGVVSNSNAFGNVTFLGAGNINVAATSGINQTGGPTSVLKTGSGTTTLAAASNYTGGTTLSQGTLVHANNDATGSVTAPITIGDANTGASNTTLRFTAGIINNNMSTVYKPITVNNVGGATTFEFNQGNSFANINIATSKAITLATTGGGNQYGMMGTISGTGAGAGNTSVTFSNTGGGTFFYTAGYTGAGVNANSFAGDVVIAGNIQLQNLSYINPAFINGVIPDTSSVTINGGATWTQQWGGESLNALNGSGNLNNSTFPITLGVSNGTGSYAGVISNTGSLTKNGTGTQTFSNKNTYTGGTTVNGGILSMTSTANNGLSTIGPGDLVINSAGTVIAQTGDNQLGHTNPAQIPNVYINGGTFTASPPYPDGMWFKGIIMTGGLLNGTTGLYANDAVGSFITSLAAPATAVISAPIHNFKTNLVITVADGAPASDLSITGAFVGNSAANAVTKQGPGTLQYGAAATYTGATTVDAGQLLLFQATGYNSPTTVNSGAKVSFSGNADLAVPGAGATILLNNGSTLENLNPLNWTVLSAPVTIAAGASVTINQNSVATGVAGRGFYFDGGLKSAGPATVTINAINAGSGVNFRNNNTTFAGTMIVNGIVSSTPFAGSGIGVGGNTTGLQNADITLNGTMELLNQGIGWANTASGAFRMGALNGAGTMIGNFTAGGVTTVTIGNTNANGSFSGLIANGTGNTLHLAKVGSGTQILSNAANSFTGTMHIMGGVLEVPNLGAIGQGTGANWFAVQNGATFRYTGATTQSTTARDIYWNSGAAIFDITSPTGEAIFNTTVVGAGPFRNQTMTKIGAGKMTLASSVAGFVPTLGTINLNAGSFQFAANAAGTTQQFMGTFNGANGTTLFVSGPGVTRNDSLTANWSANQANLEVASGATFDLRGNNVSVNSLNGSGSIINSYFQNNSGIIGHTLTVGVAGGSGVFGGAISGTGTTLAAPGQINLVKNGAGTQVLSGANTYGGTTTVNAGILRTAPRQAYQITTNTASNQAYGGSLGYDFTVNAGKTITVTHLGFYDAGLNGLATTHNVYISTTGGATLATGVVANGVAAPLSAGYRFVALTTPIVLGPGTYTVWGDNYGTDQDYNSGGTVNAGPVDPGNADITYTGTNRFGGSNAYPTTIDGGPVYRYGAASFQYTTAASAQIMPATTPVTVAAGATFDVNNMTQSIGSLAGPSGSSVTLGTAQLTTGGDNTSTTFAGIISGAGGINKAGAGVFTLTGANTYAGQTNVQAGTLLVNNTTGSGTGTGPVVVQSGATLGGTGAIAGTVTVQSGGFFSPGTSPADIATGSLTLSAGSSYVVEINGTTPNTQYDQTIVTGAVNLGGSLNATVGFTPALGDKFVLIVNDGSDPVNGFFSNAPAEMAPIAIGSLTYHVTYKYDSVSGTEGVGNDVALIRNRNPVAIAGSYTISEGDPLPLDASGSSDIDGDTLTYRWDVDGDGDFDENITGTTPTVTWATLQSLGIDDGPQTRTIRVEANDGLGGVTVSTGTLNFQLNNTAPTAALAGPSTAGPGQPITFTFGATDPSSTDTAATFTYTINWGDSTPIQIVTGPASGVAVVHTFTNLGSYTVSVTATDKDNDTGPAATQNIDVVPVYQDGNGNIIAGGLDNFDDQFSFSPASGGKIQVTWANAASAPGGPYPTKYGPFTLPPGAKLIAFGQGGNDTITSTVTGVPVSFDGGAGNDYMAGSTADDSFIGGEGNDRIVAGNGNDFIDGGSGADSVDAGADNDTVFGGAGIDTLNGGAGNDLMDGGDDGDIMNGGAGSDIMFGGGGNDNLNGVSDNDVLVGGEGDDILSGDVGRDILLGGNNKDTLNGGGDDDVVSGGLTSYDNYSPANAAAVQALLAEWGGSNPYATRITNLKNGGGANGTNRLNPGAALGGSITVVNDDGFNDTVNGGIGTTGGTDWFLASTATSGPNKDTTDRVLTGTGAETLS